MMAKYDEIIVGAGSAGSVLAAGLSDDQSRPSTKVTSIMIGERAADWLRDAGTS
jgi:flavin-dependent dehydrogenase